MNYAELFETEADELARLDQAVIAAHAAFVQERSRANLEAVWAAQAARDAFQEKTWPSQSAQTVEPDSPHDYMGEHQAPDHDTGSPLFDLTLNGTYPKDFYSGRNREYASDPMDGLVLSQIMEFHNRPNMPLKIYRAIPQGIPRKINVGDWVTINRRYALEHGRANLRNEFVVVSKTVFARDIFTDGSLQEWGYDPQPRVVRRPNRIGES